MSFSKGRDLEKQFPEIAKLVTTITGVSGYAHSYVFNFRRAEASGPAGNLFRYRGMLSEASVDTLIGIHKLGRWKSKLKSRTNDGWTEMYAPFAIEHLKLAQPKFSMDFFPNIYDLIREVTEDEDDPMLVFVNGRLVDRLDFYLRTSRKDVVVIISESQDEWMGTIRDFDHVPGLEVYVHDLEGPYSDKGVAGRTPADLWIEDDIRDAWGMGTHDFVICPTCGSEDCDTHKLTAKSMVYIKKYGRAPKFVLAVQSYVLESEDATEALMPFAPLVLGRKLKEDYEWPAEILELTIDGVNHTHSTCSEDIDEDSTVKIVLSGHNFKG